ncbi:insulinase family protein [Tolumonas lignilytica]|uniref:insulinase family protein n=1 Tax=Tolumonas lignilytica TaxID=1283284 RepID=UPI00046355BA|nr:insulinase family protein [Tolumonas lignilytica]
MQIFQAPEDRCEYRYRVLANGLRVLLIHDPVAERSAASMAVACGHFSDPPERMGMAHFLEHMLFLGTASYPHPGEYQAFIAQHGGNHNAWTGTEHSNYFFDIATEFFDEALHRFSQFFICPSFNADLVERERHAIDSEYRLKISDDVRRCYQVHKETVNPAHPFSKFSVGNLDTLHENNGESLREEVKAFFERHYSSDCMTLVVQSQRSLDEQESTITPLFSAIARRPPSNSDEITEPLYREQDLRLRIQIKPLKELRRLSVSFALPNVDADYQTKPLTYISHLLGDEGKGSLFAYMKRKGWISALSAGGGVGGSNFRDFQVNFSLTPKGLKYETSIIEHLFCFLRLIAEQGINDWRYGEKASLLQIMYQVQEHLRPLDNVSHLSMNLFHYAPADVIQGDYLMTALDAERVREMLALISPDNMRITLIAPDVTTTKTAKWYDTPYHVEPIETAWLNIWRNAALPDPKRYRLPEPNPFLPDRFTTRPDTVHAQIPRRLIHRAGLRVWHQQDASFATPKANVFIAVDSEHAVLSPYHIAMTRLMVDLLLDHLNEFTYPAELAGLNYNIYAHQGGFTIQLSGFSCRLYHLLELLLKNRTAGHYEPERFYAIKEQLLRNWRNQNIGRPIAHLFSQLTSLLQPNNPPVESLIAHLESVEPSELPEFMRRLFQAVHLEVLAHGDIQADEVRQIAGLLERQITPNSLPSRETRRRLVDIRKAGTLLYECPCPHNDSALLLYYQSAEKDANSIACYTLANHIMSSPFFHDLRTQQQLGYVVGTGNLPLNRHPGLVFYVQSPVMAPDGLLAAIELFIDAFHMQLLEMNEQTWLSNKQGLISQLTEADANLRARSQRLWGSIGSRDFSFRQRELVVTKLGQLSRADFIRFIRSLRSSQADRVVLYSQGDAHQETASTIEGMHIDYLAEFQQTSAQFQSI